METIRRKISSFFFFFCIIKTLKRGKKREAKFGSVHVKVNICNENLNNLSWEGLFLLFQKTGPLRSHEPPEMAAPAPQVVIAPSPKPRRARKGLEDFRISL